MTVVNGEEVYENHSMNTDLSEQCGLQMTSYSCTMYQKMHLGKADY